MLAPLVGLAKDTDNYNVRDTWYPSFVPVTTFNSLTHIGII